LLHLSPFPLFSPPSSPFSRPYWKILENTSYTSIADTGRFWKILVIPVVQLLEDSGKYWLYQYCRYWKISYEVAECIFVLIVFSLFFPVSLYTVRPLITDAQTGQKKHNEYKNTFRNFVANLPVSAILV
jgi:hypothetical protein